MKARERNDKVIDHRHRPGPSAATLLLSVCGWHFRHPQATLIAHEPPVAFFLPEADDAIGRMHDVYDTYCHSGIGAAWARFATVTGMSPPLQGGDAPPQPSVEMVGPSERFFGHGLLPIALYEPDLSALEAGPTRLIVAAGNSSKGEFAQRTAAAVAERLGTSLVDFPGGHTGFASDPEDFAAVLRRVLG